MILIANTWQLTCLLCETFVSGNVTAMHQHAIDVHQVPTRGHPPCRPQSGAGRREALQLRAAGRPPVARRPERMNFNGARRARSSCHHAVAAQGATGLGG